MLQRLISYIFPALAQSEPPPPIRRVVTGHNAHGKGTVKSNTLIPGEVGVMAGYQHFWMTR